MIRRFFFWAGLAAVAAAAAWMICGKERLRAEGRTVLLELAPVDPRSLMQGDYMRLAYTLQSEAPPSSGLPRRGRLVLKLDANGIGRFARLDDSSPLAGDEVRIAFKNRGGLRIGAETFLFEEGSARRFQRARYARLLVNEQGEALLAGLLDAGLKEIPRAPPRE